MKAPETELNRDTPSQETSRSGEISRLLRTATRASVSVSVLLVCAKFYAWFTTGSIAVLASLLDSLMDTAASLINLFAVDYSLKPADRDHRFGHGKAEALAGLGQATFIAFSAVFLLYQATDRFIHPQAVDSPADAVWVILLAVVITGALVTFQRFVVKRTGSTAVAADSLHYLTDLFTNAATLTALLLVANGWLRADSIFGLVISLYIFYSAIQVGWVAVRILMDEELPESERRTIVECVEATEGVIKVRRLRSWRSGQRRVVDLDVVFDRSRVLSDIHANSDLVVQHLIETVPEVDVSIRAVPDGEAGSGGDAVEGKPAQHI